VTGGFLPAAALMGPVQVDLVLTPVDASPEAERAVDYAVAVARRYDADLHLLHVLDERDARGMEAGDVEAEAVAKRRRAFTDAVRDRVDDLALSTSSTAGFSTRSLSRTPGSAVLDAATELEADFLVVPRETPRAEADTTIGKAALYVLQYADQPVLSV